ncbi:MAG: hypothetical protein ACNS62_08730 [Candidatus Cyclobacteriaceae bacterium M3_2C_046]
MSEIKLLCWNMEWMNDLFTSDHSFKPDQAVPYHHPRASVKSRRKDLSGVINQLAPDILVAVEGPNHLDEWASFVHTDLEGDWHVWLQPTKGSSQCVAFALKYDSSKFAHDSLDAFDTVSIPEFQPFEFDTENDGIIEKYKFERLPLYVQVNLRNGRSFRILGLHLKSKGIFQALEWGAWWDKSLANRKKILAQASHLRNTFLNHYLIQPETKDIPLLVCGDINDGPGFDVQERRLLGSAVERLTGSVWHPHICLGNALFDTLDQDKKMNLQFDQLSTTRFRDPIFNQGYHYVWIDHILYSKNADNWVGDAWIHKKINQQWIWQAFPDASDHQPISAKIYLD